jgi:hypothetical protein
LAILRAASGVAPDLRQETTTLRPSCVHMLIMVPSCLFQPPDPDENGGILKTCQLPSQSVRP